MADDEFDLSLDEDEETEATLALDEDDVTLDEDDGDDMTVAVDADDEDDGDEIEDEEEEDDPRDAFDAADVGMAVADMRKNQGTLAYSLFLILSFLLYSSALTFVLLEIHEYSDPDQFLWGLLAEEK